MKNGHFECMVMPFGLTNAPAAVALRSARPHCSGLSGRHPRLLGPGRRPVCSCQTSPETPRCEFHTTRTEFLGFAVLHWPLPTKGKKLEQFLGYANFYRRFIKGYSSIISSLTKLLKEDAAFRIDQEPSLPSMQSNLPSRTHKS